MKKKDWQQFHGLDDEEMELIDYYVKDLKVSTKDVQVLNKPFKEYHQEDRERRRKLKVSIKQGTIQ